MGTQGSKCSDLAEQMGWSDPELADEFNHPGLVNYLQMQNLEVVLPKHAPNMDLSIADRKPSMYPRPNFCWEAYKMHLALIGPSTACKNQTLAFLPKLVSMFKGPPSKLAPGRDAVPYYLFDSELHKMVIWELPEITFNQKVDDYIRELGLMYIDCVFILFSEKYMLNDIYCKLIVEMAIHGIPFFVVCTDSTSHDEETMKRVKTYFQRKDIQGIRMLNPNNPGEMLTELINDFYKEIAWNRCCIDKVLTADLSENILGQTVRLKDLVAKPELNGRCGVCVGFDKEQSRYRIRLITKGVESDIALKSQNFSILKPKLLYTMVKIHSLQSKPELNGRYGFVDAFLRETERYRVFIPDRPGQGLELALQAKNLERVEQTRGEPVKELAPPDAKRPAVASSEPKPSPPKPSTPTYGPFVAESRGGQTWKVVGGDAKGGIIVRSGKAMDSEVETQRLSTNALVEEMDMENERLKYRLLYGTGPRTGWVSLKVGEKDLVVKSNAVVSGSRTATAPTSAASPSKSTVTRDGRDSQASFSNYGGVSAAKASADRASWRAPDKEEPLIREANEDTAAPRKDAHEADEGADDLMSRIRAAEKNVGRGANDAGAERKGSEGGINLGEVLEKEARAAASAPTSVPVAGGSRRSRDGVEENRRDAQPSMESENQKVVAPVYRRLNKKGLLGMKVWALLGDPDKEEVEELMDHLMDCGRTVFSVAAEGGHVPSVAELNSDPALPQAEVLALVDPDADLNGVVTSAAGLGLKGVIFHPNSAAFSQSVTPEHCRAANLTTFEADVLEEVVPGSGLPIAAID